MSVIEGMFMGVHASTLSLTPLDDVGQEQRQPTPEGGGDKGELHTYNVAG